MDKFYVATTLDVIALVLLVWRRRGGGWISKSLLVLGVVCIAASLFLVLTARVG